MKNYETFDELVADLATPPPKGLGLDAKLARAAAYNVYAWAVCHPGHRSVPVAARCISANGQHVWATWTRDPATDIRYGRACSVLGCGVEQHAGDLEAVGPVTWTRDGKRL